MPSKLYLYILGGVGLLIAVLSLLLYIGHLKGQNSTLTTINETYATAIKQLQAEREDLIASGNRKAGAADAYSALTSYVSSLTNTSVGIIKGYKARETEDEKCLDKSPPASMVLDLKRVWNSTSSGNNNDKRAP